jgi:hypothetical protein
MLDVLAGNATETNGKTESRNNQVTIMGIGPAGVVALCAAAIDSRIAHVVTIDSLSSFVTEAPYEHQRLGILPNGIVRDVGDVSQIAALIAPRRLTIIGSINAHGDRLDEDALERVFSDLRKVYSLENAAKELSVHPMLDGNEIRLDIEG